MISDLFPGGRSSPNDDGPVRLLHRRHMREGRSRLGLLLLLFVFVVVVIVLILSN